MNRPIQPDMNDPQERIDALRVELHGLYEAVERTGSTVRRIDEIAQEIAQIQEEKYVATDNRR